MKKILSWVLTIIFIPLFLLSLVSYHLFQMIALNLGGYYVHLKVIHHLQIVLINLLKITGFSLKIINKNHLDTLPNNRPLIIVSNHQSMFDIPFILWYFRKHEPKFVAKKELGKYIPSISYHLKYGGNAMIDRKDKVQSVKAISDLGAYCEKNIRSAVIFPEGGRAKDGVIRPFKESGVLQLVQSMPSALIVPLVIRRSWELVRFGFFPIPFGIKCELIILPPIEPKSVNSDILVKSLEQAIGKELEIRNTSNSS
jgi:1-acyl-sn-glycerol-3-phosphate acyltransferase